MNIVPIKQDEAKAFVTQNHRHHKAPAGSIFQIGCAEAGEMIGVAMVGRPVSRELDNGWTLEVNRLCVKEGNKNACSMLYAACWRACKALGYTKCITYILDTEPGTSLNAAGWKCIGKKGGGTWNTPARPRVDKHPNQMKIKYEIE